MMWLTWRQLRAQAAVLGGGIVALMLALVATGPHLVQLSRTAGPRFLAEISGGDRALFAISALAVLAVPALIGLFWGAPLITRELDTGTYRLAWTQTTRTRWLAVKLAVIGLTAMAAAGLLSLAVSWWASPVDAAITGTTGTPSPSLGVLIFPRISRELFDSRGIVPVGYAAFAFTLAVLLGVLVRRTLPAMALFLAVFAVSQVLMSVAVRPNLAAHDQQVTTITNANLLNLNVANSLTIQAGQPGAWVFGQQTVNAAGQPAKAPSSVIHCMLANPSDTHCLTQLAAMGYRQRISYIPATKFWQLQTEETVIYLVIALALSAACVVAVKRRLS